MDPVQFGQYSGLSNEHTKWTEDRLTRYAQAVFALCSITCQSEVECTSQVVLTEAVKQMFVVFPALCMKNKNRAYCKWVKIKNWKIRLNSFLQLAF